jgi:hypothetical protein
LGTAGPFSDSQLSAAVGYRGGWVVVGSHFEDRFTSAQAYSGDLARWKAGVAAHPGDLRGNEKSERWMSAVVSADVGVVAVGVSAGGPAVWRSSDGSHWQLIKLAGPAGASIDHVVASGSRLVAVGTAGSGATGPYAWVSNDRGGHWSSYTLPVRKAWTGDTSPVAVLRTGTGYVVVGSAGPYGRQTTVMWTSPDGVHWRMSPVTVPDLHGGGQRTPNSAVAVGDRLVGVATVASVQGTGPIAFNQPLR